jgi:hypothetical protein
VVNSTTLLAQGTDAFTYQGRLESANLPATGIYDLKFTVHSADLGGNIVAGPLTYSGVSVSNGLFTVVLNFGSGVFTGPERWLGIEARTNGAALYTRLTPRQPITPTPYAQYTANAANAATANGVSPDSVTASGIASGQVVKSLNNLHDDVTQVAGANVTRSSSKACRNSGRSLNRFAAIDRHDRALKVPAAVRGNSKHCMHRFAREPGVG